MATLLHDNYASAPPRPPAERHVSLDLSSLHCMRRASLVVSAHNQTSQDSCGGSSFSSETFASSKAMSMDSSVKFSARNFVSQRTETLASFYEIEDLLGAGGFGEVYRCKHMETGAERAVKVLKKNTQRPQLNDGVIEEFNMLRNLDSPNLLKVYEMFEDIAHFYIITDLYKGGDLFGELEESGPFSEPDAAVVIHTILSCVNYCHGRGLAHCDLKPENILFDGQDLNDLKIIDFGLAQYENTNEKFTCTEGSHYYVSPQVIQGSYSSKCDIWACGVICYILLSGCAPFDGDSTDEILDAVTHGIVDFDFDEWDGISNDAKQFILELLQYEEEDRPTAEQALRHPWLQDQRKKSLAMDDTQRAAARQSLMELRSFATQAEYGKLKQATCAIIASQLLKKEEKDEIDEVFRNLDRSCDGYLDRDDLKKGCAEYFDMNLSEQEIDTVFKHANVSGSGKIGYSEFSVVMMVQKDMIKDKLDAAFRFFDKEDKGFITMEDIKKALNMGDNEDEYLKKKILKQADLDEDGVVNYAEFRDMMLSGKVVQSRRVSIARTPRKASMAFSERCASMGLGSMCDRFSMGLGTSEQVQDWEGLGASSNSNHSISNHHFVIVNHGRRRLSDGLAALSRRSLTAGDNPLGDLEERDSDYEIDSDEE